MRDILRIFFILYVKNASAQFGNGFGNLFGNQLRVLINLKKFASLIGRLIMLDQCYVKTFKARYGHSDAK